MKPDTTVMKRMQRNRRGIGGTRGFTFVDLFAGIGGFRLAFSRVGGKCLFSSELDKFARETYRANFGEEPAGDIRNIRAEQIPTFDILCAGFPCQAFSLAGVSKKNALGLPHGFRDKNQGNLFFEIERILKTRRPAAFILENVKNLISHDKGNTFARILKILEVKLGYYIHYTIINASDVVPQNRPRLFIVGFRSLRNFKEFKFPEFKNGKKRKGPGPFPHSLEKILIDNNVSKYILSDHLWNYLQQYKEKHRRAGNGFGYTLTERKGIARTLSARYHKDGSEILIPMPGQNPRRLTPRECARLMGFPDSFKIVVSDTQAYRQFGNSVVVPVVEKLAQAIVVALQPSLLKVDVKKGKKNILHETA